MHAGASMGCFGKPKKKPDVDEPVEAQPLLPEPPAKKAEEEDKDDESEDSSEDDDEESSDEDDDKSHAAAKDRAAQSSAATRLQATRRGQTARREARNAAEERTMLQRAVASLIHRELVRGWRVWLDVRRDHQLLSRSMSHLRHRDLGAGWSSWLEVVAANEAFARALPFLIHRGIARGWSSWCDHVQASSSDGARRDAAMRRMRNCGLSRGWARWRTAADELRHQLESMRASLGHLLHRHLSVAWGAWAEMSTARAAALHAVEIALGAMRHRHIRKCWSSWCTRCQSDGARLDAVGSALHQLANRERLRCWRAWVEWLEQLGRLSRGLGFLRNRQLGAVWGSWKDYLELDCKWQHAVSVLRRRSIGRYWREWTELRGQAIVLDGAVRKLRNRELVSGIGAWLSWMAENAIALSRLRRACGALGHTAMRRGWLVWRENGATDHQAELGKCFAHLLYGQVSRGFAAWVGMVEAFEEKLMVLKRGVSALINKQLSAAWMSWREAADLLGSHRRRTQRKAQRKRALGFLKQTNVVKAWLTWRTYTSESRDAQSTLAASRDAFRTRGQRAALSSWSEQASRLLKLGYAMRKLTHQQLSRVYGTWVEMAVGRREYLTKLKQGAGRMLNRKLAVGFATWHRACPYRKTGGAVGGALRGLFGGGAAPMLGFFGVEESRDEKMARALRRLATNDLHRGWAAWAELIAARTEIRRTMGHMFNGELAKAVRAWKEMVSERHGRLNAIGAAARRLLNHRTRKLFAQWCGALDARNQTLQTIRKCVSHMLNRRIATGFATWRRALYAKAQAKSKDSNLGLRAGTFFVQGSTGGLRGAWLTWQGRHGARFKARKAYEYVLAHACEPRYEPRRPGIIAKSYSPGSELFDRTETLKVRDGAGRSVYQWSARTRPEKAPRRPVETPEEVERRRKLEKDKLVKGVKVGRRPAHDNAPSFGTNARNTLRAKI